MAQRQHLATEEAEEVVRVAVRMHQEETSQEQQSKAAADAAEELGVPPEYLERAAAQVRVRRQAQVRRRRRQIGALAGVVVALAGLGFWWRIHPPPSGATSFGYTFDDPTKAYWQLDTTSASQARVVFAKGRGADIHVQRLVRETGEEPYRVDLSTLQTPPDLTRYRSLHIRLRGTGIGQIRVFLENANERWCSPFLTASGDWHVQEVALAGFLRQTRPSAFYNWTDAPTTRPVRVGRISIKLGAHANPETATGNVQIGELEFH